MKNSSEIFLLSTIAEVFNGKTPSNKEKRDTGHPVLKIKDISENGQFIGKFDSFVDDSFFNKYKDKRIRMGDTLILNAAHNSDYVGTKVCFANVDIIDTVPTGEWLIIRPIKHNAFNRFIFYFLISAYGRYFIKNLVKGIHLYPKDVANIKIPLPPLDIQKKIAAVLDKADRLRQLRKQAMEKLDKLEKSLFMDFFGDPALNKKGFNLVPLEDLYSKIKNGVKCGPFGSALKKDEYTNEGIPVWIMDNIKENQFCEEGCLYISHKKFNQLKHYSVENGDILISRAGTVGKMCVLNYSKNPSIINTNLIKLSLDRDKIEPYYFTSLMTFFKGRVSRLKTGDEGSYTFMNTGILNKLKISLPPYYLQRRYVSIANKIQLIKNKMIMDLQKKDILFNSLLQRAFKGELGFNDEYFDKLEKENREII